MRSFWSALVGAAATALLALVLAHLVPPPARAALEAPPPPARVLDRAPPEVADLQAPPPRQSPRARTEPSRAARPGAGAPEPKLVEAAPRALARALRAGPDLPVRRGDIGWPAEVDWTAETLLRALPAVAASVPGQGGAAPGRKPPPERAPRGPTRAAVAIHAPHPPYPASARARNESGVVEVLIAIDATGRVTGVDVVASSGSEALADSVRRTVSSWRFTPALRDGEPRPTTIRRRFDFRLVDG